MIKILSAICLLGISAVSYGQGLVAHWDMSSGSDVSGNNHHGRLVNVTPATGMDGIAGHGYYFNGSNSMITVPFDSAFNVQKYSITAVVKVQGYYSGACQNNILFTRGKTGTGSGNYQVYFSDAPSDGDCTSRDTTNNNFIGTIEGRSLSGVMSGFNYTPHIASNVWYKLVVTFNDTCTKTYIDGVLKSTVNLVTPGVAVGTSTDSISIGFNTFESAAGYPFGFKGVLDDIKLFNRVLSDSEAVHFADTCGTVNFQPSNTYKRIGDTARYSISSTIVGSFYQWQVDTGTGYYNLTNTPPYSGVFTPNLSVFPVTTIMDSSKYRCIAYNNLGCKDTSSSAYGIVTSVGISQYNLKDAMIVFPNPSDNQFSVTLPYSSGIGKLVVLNQIGQLIVDKQITGSNTKFDLSNSPAGIYILKIEYLGEVIYQRITKK